MVVAADDISLTIDGRPVSVPAGATLLDAASAAGVEVPTLCFHPNMAASANCRLCVVEQSLSPDGSDAEPPPGAPERQASKLLPSCRAKAEPGQVVYTQSHNVLASRRGSLRLLLGGVDLSEAPELADLCADYGLAVGTAAEREPFPIYVDNPLLHPRLQQVRHVLALCGRLRRPGAVHLCHRAVRAWF